AEVRDLNLATDHHSRYPERHPDTLKFAEGFPQKQIVAKGVSQPLISCHSKRINSAIRRPVNASSAKYSVASASALPNSFAKNSGNLNKAERDDCRGQFLSIKQTLAARGIHYVGTL